MNPRGERRAAKWEASGRTPTFPLTRCCESAIPSVSFSGGELDSATLAALRAINPRYVVKYDICTTNGFGPGHHLYEKDGEQDGSALLRMVFPLQYDLDRQWPEGGPRAPGPWLIEAVKRHLAKPSADEQLSAAVEAEEQRERKNERDREEHAKHFGKEMGPWVRAHLTGQRRGGVNAARRRSKKDPKVQVAVK